MKKFTSADYLTMPWKNGGGVTTQLAIEPAVADLGNFDWRISTAQVASSGPFSLFAGIDRSLAVLQGSGLSLDFDGRHTTFLRPDSKPLAFRGEQQIHATLLDGPVTDFNVMTRRQHCAHELEIMQLHGSLQCARNADLMFIYCARGAAVHCRNAAGTEADFLAGESLLINGSDGDHIDLIAAAPALLYVARLVFKGKQDAQ